MCVWLLLSIDFKRSKVGFGFISYVVQYDRREYVIRFYYSPVKIKINNILTILTTWKHSVTLFNNYYKIKIISLKYAREILLNKTKII